MRVSAKILSIDTILDIEISSETDRSNVVMESSRKMQNLNSALKTEVAPGYREKVRQHSKEE